MTDAKIGYATRILQNMLDAGDIGPLPTDTEGRFREMLATLREAQAEVVEMRADQERRQWGGFRAKLAGRMQKVR